MTAPPLLLDGAMGTELIARGCDPGSIPDVVLQRPSWVTDIHRAYVEAGAQLLTTCTLTATTADERATERRLRAATALARAAATDATRVAGSIGPLAHWCADPDERRRRYASTAAILDADCDLLLVEAMTDPTETALALASISPLVPASRLWLGIVADGSGDWLTGSPLADTLGPIALGRVDTVLVHCVPAEDAGPALRLVGAVAQGKMRRGVYPSALPDHDAQAFARTVARLARAHALDVVGGCCGTGPADIGALRRELDASTSAHESGQQ